MLGSLAALAVRQAPVAGTYRGQRRGAASPTTWRAFIDRLDADPDGLVLKKGLGSPNGACLSFVEYLARLTVAQPDLPVLDDLAQWLFMSMDKDTMDGSTWGER